LGANAAWCEANHTVYLKVGMGSLDIFEWDHFYCFDLFSRRVHRDLIRHDHPSQITAQTLALHLPVTDMIGMAPLPLVNLSRTPLTILPVDEEITTARINQKIHRLSCLTHKQLHSIIRTIFWSLHAKEIRILRQLLTFFCLYGTAKDGLWLD
jgi:hypothetical protein